MSDDVMKTYISQLLEAQVAPQVTVAWQGGEPTLMGLAFFERAVEIAERHRRPGQRIVHTIQTNATLLDGAWGAFLAEHNFLVGVSLDGPPALNDAYRVDRRGRPTSDRVLRGLEILQRNGVEYNILCTVHAANGADPLGVYRYFRDDCRAQFIQFIPIVEHQPTDSDDATVSDRSITAEKWGRFLIEVFDEWLRHDVGSVFVQGFDAALASWMGLPTGVCIFAETCGNAVALEHNGDVYSCDHFVTPDHLLGNIRQSHIVELVADKRDRLPAYCMSCDVRFACWGECPKNRFARTPSGEDGLNYLCHGYKAFFHHVDGPMKLMSELVRSGRPAMDIRDVFARVPRNESCPCGSGRKAKHCHGG
jgi:uncharacterized protein